MFARNRYMTTANNPDNNLSPWKPGQSGNSSGRPKGTRELAGHVLESTGGGVGVGSVTALEPAADGSVGLRSETKTI